MDQLVNTLIIIKYDAENQPCMTPQSKRKSSLSIGWCLLDPYGRIRVVGSCLLGPPGLSVATEIVLTDSAHQSFSTQVLLKINAA
jgi:hypothetical protein